MAEVIVEVVFPTTLKEGELVTGTITVHNPLSKLAATRFHIETYWNNKVYTIPGFYHSPCEKKTVKFPDDFEWWDAVEPRMPNRNAIIYISVTVFVSSDEYVVERKWVEIMLYTEPWWWPVAVAGAVVGVVAIGGVIAYQELARR